MIRGLYTAGAGMLVNNQKMKNIDENIENQRTPGYLQIGENVLSFPEHLALRLDHFRTQSHVQGLGFMGTGSYISELSYKMGPGLIRETGNRTGMAINGDGFFVLSTPNGEALTRNGHLMRDPSGFLRSVGGNPVLGIDNNPIGPVPEDFTVMTDGRVTDSATGNVIGQLRIVSVEPGSLTRVNRTTMYTSNAPVTDMIANRPMINQGFVEESNVDLTSQMVKMIETNRAFSMNQRMVQANDQILQRTVNEVGRIV
jgi:flagellar basal-body rod protein FlgG